MRNYFIMTLFLFSFSALSKINIRLSPSFPTAGESFDVIFSIESRDNLEPFLNFDPSGVEVIGRSKAVSNQIQFINGRTTSKQTHIFTYEMKAPTARTAFLRNITADIGSDTVNHKDVSIKIAKELKISGDTFILAEVSNDNPYIGEAVDVKYYLYTRDRSLQSVEIKEFPKLNGFIKRFHKLQEREEVVQYNGQVYRRYLKYSAKVFPEKTGELKIDPLRLSLRFQVGNNRIGFFSSSFGRTKEKTKGSKTVKIRVKDLPAENVPPTFTGLVGKHNAKISINRTKYLMNEPIEARLEITGVGALEKLGAPKLWESKYLEDFDTKSEYVDIDKNVGRKIFDYTYLVRGNGIIEPKTKKLFYFDPGSQTYEPMEIELKGLTLSGAVASSPAVVNNDGDNGEREKESISRISSETSVMAPIFNKQNVFEQLMLPKWIIKILALVYVFLIAIHFYQYQKRRQKVGECDKILKTIYAKGLTYRRLNDYILSLRKNNNDTDMKAIINESSLKNDDKKYFLSTIKKLEEQGFYDGLNDDKKIKINKKSLESLRSLML